MELNKCVILDTNVLIENPECVYEFENCHIVIPIAVIEELDNLKMNKSYEIRKNARRSSDILDSLTETKEYIEKEYAELPNGSRLTIECNHQGYINIEPEKPDNRIISVAIGIQKSGKYKDVILISRDMNVRIKARQHKIKAEKYDYYKEQLKDIDTGILTLYEDSNIVNEARKNKFLETDKKFKYNQHVFLVDNINPNNTLLMTYDNISKLKCIVDYSKNPVYGVRAKNIGQNFAMNDIMNIDKPVNIVMSNKSGCGKNYIITACCLDLLRMGYYDRLIYIKPMVAVDKDIGALPGDKEEKINPWFQDEEDTMDVLLNGKIELYHQMISERKIELDIVSFARGRNIPRAIIWVNEAQNFTAHQMWTIATRVASDSKLIVSGDLSQIDHKHLDIKNCGLNVFATVSRNNPDATYICLTTNKKLRGPVAEWYSENYYI